LFFGVELGLEERSADGFEDGPTLGIKLGIGSTLGVKLAWTDSPQTKNQLTINEVKHTQLDQVQLVDREVLSVKRK
jgi:hypothetical protein